jgi:hypothetical protein
VLPRSAKRELYSVAARIHWEGGYVEHALFVASDVGAVDASDRNDSTYPRRATAALQDFGSAYYGFGSRAVKLRVKICTPHCAS